MNNERDALAGLILTDPWRSDLLTVVREEAGEGAWIGAGFVRNLVWDRLFGVEGRALNDVDVVFLDGDAPDPKDQERRLERQLASVRPRVPWQVRNQARMHLEHGHAAYSSLAEALSHWPETATAVAVRVDTEGSLSILAPHGLADLLGGVLRPTRDDREGRALMFDRADRKGWFTRWPGLDVRAEVGTGRQLGS